MPRLVDALLQDAFKGPAQHLLQALNAAEEDVTPGYVVVALDQVAHKSNKGGFADTPLAADKADLKATLRTGGDHVAQPLYFGAASDKELNRHRLSGSERTRFRSHVTFPF